MLQGLPERRGTWGVCWLTQRLHWGLSKAQNLDNIRRQSRGFPGGGGWHREEVQEAQQGAWFQASDNRGWSGGSCFCCCCTRCDRCTSLKCCRDCQRDAAPGGGGRVEWGGRGVSGSRRGATEAEQHDWIELCGEGGGEAGGGGG
jgi:hypothetical protein